jgi:peptidoglycan/xylan/chitin deacetylase (PgdA/CDA1 family)/GT2 family glycosyltransferase
VSTSRAPRSHWVLLALVLLVLALLLAIAALTSGRRGEQSGHAAHAEQSAAPASVRGGGPVLSASHATLAGARVPARTLALTFDDGPGPYTRQILKVLERHRVPATFFVVGDQIPGHAALLRRMVADGDEVGVHTFTHRDPVGMPGWALRLELDATQLAIADATGYTTDLLRLPYSATPASLSGAQWQVINRVGNYRVVLADKDTKDWTRPGAAEIVARAIPRNGAGAVVMMHDGGGDRSETVRALEQLIPALQKRGYHFATVSRAIGVAPAWIPAGTGQRLRGAVVLDSLVLARWFVHVLWIVLLTLSVLTAARLVALLFFAARHARRREVPADHPLPAVSIVVPAFNEVVGIGACVHSLADSDYPEFEIIVVDDGSTDGTADVLAELCCPGLRVIRQVNAGKPAALNTGIAAARHDVLVLVDGDTVFEPDTLRHLVAPMADPGVGAVSGNAKVGNRQGLLGLWQHIEYVMGFNLDRRMFDVLGCMPTVPGAVGAFRRAALGDIGGVSADTLAEDTDLTMALCRRGWRVVYAPNARAWTEAPDTFGQLWRQRYRWCYGTLQAMWKHRHAVVERGAAGRLGRIGLPYLLAYQVILPMLGPVIDIAAIYGALASHGDGLLYTWLVFLALQFGCAMYAFRLDGEPVRALWALPLQQIIYRQLMYLVVVQSAASALYGLRLRWQSMRRSGVLDAAPSS